MLCVVHSLRFQSAKKCHRGAYSTGSVAHWKALERMQTILVSVHNSELGKQERKGSEYLSFYWFTIEDKSFLGKIPQTCFFSQVKPWAEKPYRRVWYKGKKRTSRKRRKESKRRQRKWGHPSERDLLLFFWSYNIDNRKVGERKQAWALNTVCSPDLVVRYQLKPCLKKVHILGSPTST